MRPNSLSRLIAVGSAVVLWVFASVSARAQSQPNAGQPPRCAADSAFHVLDFWVGTWNVVDSAGTQVGKSRIEKILDGCAITETWNDSQGEGRSLFYYVPAQRQWKQVWVTPQALSPGGVKEKHLVTQGPGRVRFQGEIIGPRGLLILDRTTLTSLAAERLRQVIEISLDGGSSWRTTFDAIYVPAKPAP